MKTTAPAKVTKKESEKKIVTPVKKTAVEMVQPALLDVTSEKIAERAYQLWQARGCSHGQDREDWLQAEAELRN